LNKIQMHTCDAKCKKIIKVDGNIIE
jgi:hypothetical protein